METEGASRLDFRSIRTRWTGRTGRNGLEGHAITLIYDDEMSQIEDLEKLGIHFDFKDLRNGELVERTHYHRRDNRQTRSHKLDRKSTRLNSSHWS